jgi:hypothetical protein
VDLFLVLFLKFGLNTYNVRSCLCFVLAVLCFVLAVMLRWMGRYGALTPKPQIGIGDASLAQHPPNMCLSTPEVSRQFVFQHWAPLTLVWLLFCNAKALDARTPK